MIKIVAVSTLKPGVLQDYLQAAAELIEKSNQEEGCISYQIYQDKNDETKVAMFEEWKEMRKPSNCNNNSEHFTRICPPAFQVLRRRQRCDFLQGNLIK